MKNRREPSLKPVPDNWAGADVAKLLDQASSTRIGRRTRSWMELESEFIRLEARVNELETANSDRLMCKIIRKKMDENREGSQKLASEISVMPAKATLDVICKLAVARRLCCGRDHELSIDQSLSSGALEDLLILVNARRAKAG